MKHKEESKIIKDPYPYWAEIDSNKITRVEFIGKNGREFVKYVDRVELHTQDQGRTLKIIEDDNS